MLQRAVGASGAVFKYQRTDVDLNHVGKDEKKLCINMFFVKITRNIKKSE